VSTEKKWDTNWEDLMLNNVRQEHSLGVSGGSDKTYAFSANYLGEEMWLLLTLIATRLSIDSQVTDWFKAGITSFFNFEPKFPYTKWF
jgi:hypothetical protein